MADFRAVKDYQIIVFGIIICIGAILSTWLLSGGIIKFQKLQNQTITVTGSASENVTSDFATLNIGYKAQAYSLKAGYAQMEATKSKIKAYLTDKGIESKNIDFGQITYYEVYKRYGNYTTNEVDFYKFNGEVKISSNDVKLIDDISKKINELINQDIEISYSNVEYLVSNLDDVKIKMVGAATKNAKERAQSMVQSTGDNIGSLTSAKTGVFQIVPVNSTDVSDYGINDTTSIEKKVVAVVNATFSVR